MAYREDPYEALAQALRAILSDVIHTALREELAAFAPQLRPAHETAVHGDTNTLMTVDDVAARCSVQPTTVRTWIKTGALVAIRLSGRQYRIREEDLKRFLAEQARPTPATTPDVDAVVARILAKERSKRDRGR